jgi:hypothetical protein
MGTEETKLSRERGTVVPNFLPSDTERAEILDGLVAHQFYRVELL